MAIVILILIWGSTWSVIRIGLRGVPPFTGVSLRFAIASAVLLGLAWHRGVALGRRPMERRLWVVNALLSFSVSYGVVYWAEQWIPSGLAAVLFATFPLFVALMAHLWLPAERLSGRGLLGVLIGIAGVAWIFSDDLGSVGGARIATAAFVMLLSPISSAAGNVAVKKWGRGIHPLSLTAVPMGLCSIVMGLLALLFERQQPYSWSQESVGAVIYLAIAGSAVTFTLYFWLLSFVPATQLSLITYAVPVVAVGLGTTWMDESVSAEMIGGTVLILLGVGLAMTRHRRRATQAGGAGFR